MGIQPGCQYAFTEDYGPIESGTHVYCVGIKDGYAFFHLRQSLFGASQLKLKLCEDLHMSLRFIYS